MQAVVILWAEKLGCKNLSKKSSLFIMWFDEMKVIFKFAL